MTRFALLLALLLPALARAADSLIIEAPPRAVTVYLSQAQVERVGRYRVPGPGTWELVVEGVSPQLMAQTLQVKGSGDITILDLGHRRVLRQPAPEVLPADLRRTRRLVEAMDDSLRRAGYALEVIQARRQALATEKAVLLANPVMNGGAKADTLTALRAALPYLRERLEDIHQAMAEAHADEDRWQARRAGLEQRLQRQRQWLAEQEAGRRPPGTPVDQVHVTVYSKAAASGELLLRYLVPGASWEPSYDLRSDGAGKPVQLTYKARVRQQTGVDWTGVRLTLSTGNPSLGQSAPALPVWYARYYRQVQVQHGQVLSMGVPQPEMAVKSLAESTEELFLADEDVRFDARAAADFTAVTRTFANVRFDVDLPYDIASDGRPRLLLIGEHELEARYRHTIVPKFDAEAFIEADVTGWGELNLLPGLANIFYDRTFVGTAPLSPDVFADTLSLPMGRDRLVRATRERTDHEEKNRALSGERQRSETWRIRVRNGHPGPIDLTVLDHIPVAAEDGIDVALTEGEGETDGFDATTGRLRWTANPKGNATFEAAYAFRIRWDRDRQLILR